MTPAGLDVVITGANSEIGASLARRLAGGGRLLLCTRGAPRHDLPTSADRLLSGTDLTRQADLSQLADEADRVFAGPFALVHSVGDFWHHRPLENTPLEAARAMIESHYTTLYGVLHALLPLMKARGGGRVIAFSCNSVQYNYPDMAAFTSAKAAVECLIRCVAHEYSRYHISANAVVLSTVRTPEVMRAKPFGDHDNYLSLDEVADFLLNVLLSSPQLLNGNTIRLLKYSSTFYHQGYYERNRSATEGTVVDFDT